MSSAHVRGQAAAENMIAATADMKLEVVVIPVADVERSKRFYTDLGWRLDADFSVGNEFRGIQFTPPGSLCSIHFGTGLTSAAPGTAQGLYLIVADIDAARDALIDRGVGVSDVFHRAGPGQPALAGRHPDRRSYASFASFKDPDGNTWLLQEITSRLPGRMSTEQTTFTSTAELATALRRASVAHGEHEERSGGQRDENWPDWYAEYIVAEQSGKPLPT
jgi:catechol 2,3-dioxygenase-like lactoylglutathione lyase family enzyme